MPREIAFLQKVIVHPKTRCWIWTGSQKSTGYGQINIGGVPIAAHRVSYAQHVGKIPDGLCVLHRCDVRSCVNPDHLFLGTKRDNILDCYSKGRRPYVGMKGKENHQAKLTNEQVREIRASSDTQVTLAKRFGVSQAKISQIKLRQAWRHLT